LQLDDEQPQAKKIVDRLIEGIVAEDPLEDLMVRLRKFAHDREWQQFHSPKNISMALIAEAAELIEHFQWLTEEQSWNLDGDKHEAVRYEMADIFIYLIRLADLLQVDLVKSANEKILLNQKKYPIERVKGKHKKYTEY
jgi:NTP pyrophosphatase (non-canonical NTP hydrolase)